MASPFPGMDPYLEDPALRLQNIRLITHNCSNPAGQNLNLNGLSSVAKRNQSRCPRSLNGQLIQLPTAID